MIREQSGCVCPYHEDNVSNDTEVGAHAASRA